MQLSILNTDDVHNPYVLDDNHKMTTLYQIACLSAASLLLLSLGISPVAASSSVNIYPPESKPYGLSICGTC